MDVTKTENKNHQLFDIHDPIQVRHLIRAIDRFIPHQMIELLGKKSILDVKLGDHTEAELTVLFSDIRDFTTLSESMTPEDNFKFINSYFSLMEPLICAHDGFIDKYIGDAIMAIFTSADNALRCSTLMVKQLRRLNEARLRAGYVSVNIGIGLNTGISMIGTIGGTSRMEGTVISDSVNVASRVESITKKYNVNLLISESTYRSLEDAQNYEIRFIDRILMKGKSKPTSIYEVFSSDLPELVQKKRETKHLFEEALAYYHLRNIEPARDILQKVVENNEDDLPAKQYLERCDEYLKNGRHETISEMSQQVEWTEANRLGIEIIDQQHYDLYLNSIKLFEAVKKDEKKSEIDAIVAFLEEYVVQHFCTEEGYMERYSYPFIDIQKREHKKFILAFTKIKMEIAELSLSKTYLLFQIQIFLIDWLLNHTCKADKHFGIFLKPILEKDRL